MSDARATLPRWFVDDVARFRRLGGDADALMPCLDDRAAAPVFDQHYFHADIWAARRIARHKRLAPHYDVGSRLDGLVSHLLAMNMRVVAIDVRESTARAEGLSWLCSDARTLDALHDESVTSLSSVHAIEHIGLGRYGDALDPEGHVKALRACARVLAPGGRFYLAVPVGAPRVMFNAHRVLDPDMIVHTLTDAGLTPLDLSAVDDVGRWIEPCDIEMVRHAAYACGCFVFERM